MRRRLFHLEAAHRDPPGLEPEVHVAEAQEAPEEHPDRDGPERDVDRVGVLGVRQLLRRVHEVAELRVVALRRGIPVAGPTQGRRDAQAPAQHYGDGSFQKRLEAVQGR